jgi:hypothetical protein
VSSLRDVVTATTVYVQVRKHKVLYIRNPKTRNAMGTNRRAIYGPVDLLGTQVQHENDEWWIIFPEKSSFGISSEEALNAFWDKIIDLWTIDQRGERRELV